MHARIPPSTVDRLSVYLRGFAGLEADGAGTVSSNELAELSGFQPAQVRKDLAYFGSFGRRGVGYDVAELKAKIRSILGLDREWNCAVIGVGRLGQALLMYPGFRNQGFNVVAAFDSDPDKVGWEVEGVPVLDLERLTEAAAERKIEIAVLAVPAAAQEVAERAVAAGIPSLLNFAPVVLRLPKGVLLRQVDLAGELQALSYRLRAQ